MMTSPIIRIRFIKEVVKHRETMYLYCQKPYTFIIIFNITVKSC